MAGFWVQLFIYFATHDFSFHMSVNVGSTALKYGMVHVCAPQSLHVKVRIDAMRRHFTASALVC